MQDVSKRSTSLWGHSLALIAAVFHMMNHATFKASLFMVVGVIDLAFPFRFLGRLSAPNYDRSSKPAPVAGRPWVDPGTRTVQPPTLERI
mgnify:CR=1 FL=1